MLKAMDFPETVLFYKVNQDRNERRFYRLRLMSTLFGEYELLREYGRIGQAGRVMHEAFETQEQAVVALFTLAKSKIRGGYRRIYEGSPHITADPNKFRPGAADFDFIDDPISGMILLPGVSACANSLRNISIH
ncbi:WGR domain-containing protein [Epibacterium sp. DP7N7-1]|nr:WGR domain-containing protein [Epibacterium sp. DP7N7-1]